MTIRFHHSTNHHGFMSCQTCLSVERTMVQAVIMSFSYILQGPQNIHFPPLSSVSHHLSTHSFSFMSFFTQSIHHFFSLPTVEVDPISIHTHINTVLDMPITILPFATQLFCQCVTFKLPLSLKTMKLYIYKKTTLHNVTSCLKVNIEC